MIPYVYDNINYNNNPEEESEPESPIIKEKAIEEEEVEKPKNLCNFHYFNQFIFAL